MLDPIDRLLSLHVADVMNREVVTLKATQTMSQAAAVFVEQAISGAPVVDDKGRCVGVLTSRDFVRRAVQVGRGATDGGQPAAPAGDAATPSTDGDATTEHADIAVADAPAADAPVDDAPAAPAPEDSAAPPSGL